MRTPLRRGPRRRTRPTDPQHPSDTRWKRRVRGVLQHLKATGRADRLAPGAWALRGSRHRPEQLLLICQHSGTRVELHLADAHDLLDTLTDVDLICADPPYALARDTTAATSAYNRDASRVVGGYVEIPPEDYLAFTEHWIQAAARALRPGGQLATITGPSITHRVHTAAEDAGLTFVSKIAVYRPFAVYSTRRPAFAHYDLLILCRGPQQQPARVWNPPPQSPRGRTGHLYAQDWWPDIALEHRPGQLRYDNSLPLGLVRRIVRCLTRDPQPDQPRDTVTDPFLGGGTSAIAAFLEGRHFIGADRNPNALRFTAARLRTEHLLPALRQPRLFTP
ncbi:hypothetical protein GKE82_23420 [Conexibacter sp. W3-3-2]|uniref:DNA-methyltransferase n=1 Tax=Conexibacter sp. W3-3-2 TaxID=2675227 RepID=UPI0012B7086A|nr:site-specific DNA-methyltransferase [Conexibacter sp. W3-3-2]MTD47155.1 hypothetical protein [Conexibacter sp. W3-3-2]